MPVGPQRYGISLDDKIALLFRAYLERATKVGPAHNELVMDRVSDLVQDIDRDRLSVSSLWLEQDIGFLLL